MATATIPKTQAQRRLAVLWFIIAGLTTALLGWNVRRWPADQEEIWKWFSPFVFPLLLLMVGTLRTSESDSEEAKGAVSSRFYFRLCWGLLLFYGLFIFWALGSGINSYATSAPPGAQQEEQADLPPDSAQATSARRLDAPSSPPPAETKKPADSPLLATLKQYTTLLTAVQGILSLALGAFFATTPAKAAPGPAPADKATPAK